MKMLKGVLGSFRRFGRRQFLKHGPRIVAVGGGTGLPVLLKGLHKHTINITAIVTVADDGGSSGRLRGEFGVLPPGDIRNCLLALMEKESMMEKLFNYRFGQGEGLAGHNMGNLLITALADITGDFQSAIREVSHVLNVRGQVLPSTLEQVTLNAELADGTHLFGESRINQATIPLKGIFLTPSACAAVPEAVTAIQEADLIILGPGSLFTSVLPNLLVPGIASAIRESRAIKCYICNIMTQSGETSGFKASAHLAAIYRHTDIGEIDYIIVNSKDIAQPCKKKYHEEGAVLVDLDVDALQEMGVSIISGDFLDEQGLIRHDPQKLASAVLSLI